MRRILYDKLITDFQSLQFDNGNSLFGNVKKYYRDDTMQSQDMLLMLDDMDETVQGITTTRRNYGFMAVYIESLEGSANESEANVRLDRVAEVETNLLNYLQKEPNNLRSWGNSNGFEVTKIRIKNIIYNHKRAENGFTEVMQLRFTVTIDVASRDL